MSCYYRALPRLITELILLAPANSEVAIVSPWLENVSLRTPVVHAGDVSYTVSSIRLSDFLVLIVRQLGVRLLFLMREQDYRSESVLGPVRRLVGNRVEVRLIEHLHAKMIVTQKLALETSANLLTTSLYRNVETCQLVANPFGNTRQYIREKLAVQM